MSTKTQKTKFAALITYVIVLICMIASFFIPVFDGNTMLIKELPAALGIITGRSFNLPSFFVSFGLTSYYTVFSARFNLAAWAVVIYAAVTILAVIAFIITAVMKKTSSAAVGIIYTFEIFTVISLLLFAFDRLTYLAMYGFDAYKTSGQTGWILLAVLGVIWLVYTVQSIRYKGGAGFAKSLLFLLSVAALLCLFLSEVAFSGGWVITVADWIKASHYFIGNYAAYSLVINASNTIHMGAVYIAAFVTAVLVMLNLLIDSISIAARSNIASKTFNIIRYGVEFIAAIVTAIIGAVKGVTPGIYLYFIMLIGLLQIVVSTIRMFTRATFEQSVEYGNTVEDEENELSAPAEESEPAIADGYYEAPDTTPVPPPVYTRSYAYQDDSFLNSLTSSERAEFYAIFIDKRRGNFYFLPEYEIGGENKEFFQSLFIYLGKIMGSISDGLMNKIYHRLNMIS